MPSCSYCTAMLLVTVCINVVHGYTHCFDDFVMKECKPLYCCGAVSNRYCCSDCRNSTSPKFDCSLEELNNMRPLRPLNDDIDSIGKWVQSSPVVIVMIALAVIGGVVGLVIFCICRYRGSRTRVSRHGYVHQPAAPMGQQTSAVTMTQVTTVPPSGSNVVGGGAELGQHLSAAYAGAAYPTAPPAAGPYYGQPPALGGQYYGQTGPPRLPVGPAQIQKPPSVSAPLIPPSGSGADNDAPPSYDQALASQPHQVTKS